MSTKLAGTFSALLEILQKDKNYLNLGGEEENVFSSDLEISQDLKNKNPSKLISLLNNILDPVSKVILDHGGTIDKYLGDAVMAFWNIPSGWDTQKMLW